MTFADAAPRRRGAIVLLLLGAGVSLLGDGLFAIALSFAVFELGGRALELGAIVGTGLLSVFVCILPAGALADRRSRKWIATCSDLVRGASQLVSAALVIAHVSSAWLLLPTSIVFGVATALHQPATVGFVAEVVPERQLVSVNGALQGVRGLMMIVGAALGGWMVDASGAGSVLMVDGATFVACAIAFALIRVPAAASHERTNARLRDGWRAARSLPWVLPGMGLVAAFVFTMLGPMQIVGPSIARASGHGASLWGAISAAIAVGLVLGGGAAIAGLTRSPLPAVRVLLVVGTTGHLALAHDLPLAAALPGYVALGAAMGMYAAMWEATKQRLVPRHTLSRIGALDWFVSLIGMMSGVAVAAMVVAVASTSTMLLAMVAGTLVLVVATFASPALGLALRSTSR